MHQEVQERPPTAIELHARRYHSYVLHYPAEHFQIGSDDERRSTGARRHRLCDPPADMMCTECLVQDSETEVKRCSDCNLMQCIICQGFCRCIRCHSELCEHCSERLHQVCSNSRHQEPKLASARKAAANLFAEETIRKRAETGGAQPAATDENHNIAGNGGKASDWRPNLTDRGEDGMTRISRTSVCNVRHLGSRCQQVRAPRVRAYHRTCRQLTLSARRP